MLPSNRKIMNVIFLSYIIKIIYINVNAVNDSNGILSEIDT